ncbi:Depudecin biosynthesis cluster-specific transcription activator DEP6 [Colletotrichum aenigma]|uniref:Depudecin biosynthesis cluster-specific transcription activator DEP6 n=1 Tax=Colletotrichum aenigma TaxID=1215731 RepID=UPI0018727E87|nr:Depudecin biosynthesis cluster-specific transcription activator DEP6 [Colletotrichum aenigma]KAF5521098.1 Depudecin biosynthesis cluster-specific transcription activator DEP6 [Colletotrichum aenigma]
MSRNSSEREAGNSSTFQSPIACESCRQRKRRCDRKLPFCLQCSHEPGRCQYPEQSKRGIPNGYLNKLETRLAETEAALFRVLSGTMDSQAYDAASSPALLSQAAWTPRQNKVDRVKEWESLPLQTPTDVQAWFRSKATESNDAATDLPAASPQSLMSSVSDQLALPQPSVERTPMSNPQPVVDIPIEPQFLAPMTPVNTGQTGNRNAPDSHSKAKELSKSHQNLYF